jgi:hypothetical protein
MMMHVGAETEGVLALRILSGVQMKSNAMPLVLLIFNSLLEFSYPAQENDCICSVGSRSVVSLHVIFAINLHTLKILV